jgi:sulfite reductase (ferredoxin)
MEKNNLLAEEKQNDLDFYRNSVAQFLNGELHPTKFRGIRVPMGIYEQRENNTYMLRLRIPAGGGITPNQIRALSKLSKEYGNGILHITTRQDIQLHRLALKDTPCVMKAVMECGLSSKGGGGNTVRNITACSESGICEKEIFNVSCHAKSLTDYLIKKPTSYTLPRKFKVAFSGCSEDCSLATVNDVGFIATSRQINGEKTNGFKVYVAGGMGSSSRIAHVLEEFVLEDEIAFIAEAIKRLFDKNGNRRNKHKARLRFL